MNLKKFCIPCLPAVLAALAAGAPASAAASTIGHTGFVPSDCPPGMIQAEDSYAAIGPGTITSFSTQTSSRTGGEQVDFLVLRPTSPGNYTVVGKSGTVTLNATGAVQTFPV